jgi:outer membrane protein TolC
VGNFGDAQLNALVEQIDISNQNVIAAEARFRQARAWCSSALPVCSRP